MSVSPPFDACAPRLHQSTAHTLLTRSPLHAWQEHRELGDEQREPTPAMERGTLIDRLLFGTGPEIVEIDAADFKTKAAQGARDAARAESKIPVLAHKLEAARAVVEVLRAKLVDLGYDLREGEHQVSVRWTSPNGGVPCEGRMDHLRVANGAAQILDLKTTADASPSRLARHMIDYGYDIQHAAYIEAVETLHPELAGRVDFVFIFCETDAPYGVVPARPDGSLRTLGQLRWRTACHRWAECLRAGIWPGYAIDTIQVSPSPRLITAAMEQGGIA